ncbi:DUF2953 domain-containing protein [Paenibacillus sp. strain BS8-2]
MFSHPYGWMLAGGFFFILLIVAVCSSKVIIYGHIKRVGSDDDSEVRIRGLFGLMQIKYKIPFATIDGMSIKLQNEVSMNNAGMGSKKEFKDEINPDKVMTVLDKLKQVLALTRDLTGWFKKTLNKVQLTEWKWSTSIGTGDAMWTAMATGAIWSVQSSVLGILSQVVQVKAEPWMEVQPIFSRSAFVTEWSCIAQIRFGYAILAGMQLLLRVKKTKGGVHAWQNILSKA